MNYAADLNTILKSHLKILSDHAISIINTCSSWKQAETTDMSMTESFSSGLSGRTDRMLKVEMLEATWGV